MAPLILEALLEMGLFGVGIVIAYKLLFFRSSQSSKELKEKKLTAENMALIKLHSSSPSEILTFLEQNVQFLSKPTVSALLDQLDIIKYTGDIDVASKCDSLKKRVATDTMEEPEPQKQIKKI